MEKLSLTHRLTGTEYNNLRESVGWGLLNPEQAERGLAHSAFLAVIRDGACAAAMGRALFDFGYTAYLCDIIVRPEYQGRGLGRQIMRDLMEQVERAAQPGDRVTFNLMASTGKEPFYETLGFIRCLGPVGEGTGMLRRITAGAVLDTPSQP